MFPFQYLALVLGITGLRKALTHSNKVPPYLLRHQIDAHEGSLNYVIVCNQKTHSYCMT